MNFIIQNYWLLLFIFGAGLGSFINVLAYRYEPDQPIFNFKKIGGRSYCPSCSKKLNWYELVPLLSFVFQLGRCRVCRAKISWQYPIVELAAGLSLALVPRAVSEAFKIPLLQSIETPDWFFYLNALFMIAALILIAASAIDYRLKILPDQSNILLALVGIAAILVQKYYGLFGEFYGSFIGHYAGIFGLRDSIWINHLAGALFGTAFFGAVILLSRGRGMGFGDLKLAGALGILVGWPDIVLSVFLAFIIGAIWSIMLMIKGGKNMKSTIPFGPFIAIGFLLMMFFGRLIVDAYFSIFPLA